MLKSLSKNNTLMAMHLEGTLPAMLMVVNLIATYEREHGYHNTERLKVGQKWYDSKRNVFFTVFDITEDIVKVVRHEYLAAPSKHNPIEYLPRDFVLQGIEKMDWSPVQSTEGVVTSRLYQVKTGKQFFVCNFDAEGKNMTGFTIDLNGGYTPMERMSVSDDFVLLEEGQTVWERLTELHKGIK